MLSHTEKKAYAQEHWDAKKTVESFQYLIQRWVEDYPSTRSALLDLQKKIYERTGVKIQYATLLRYTSDKPRDPRLSTAIPVLNVILGN